MPPPKDTLLSLRTDVGQLREELRLGILGISGRIDLLQKDADGTIKLVEAVQGIGKDIAKIEQQLEGLREDSKENRDSHRSLEADVRKNSDRIAKIESDVTKTSAATGSGMSLLTVILFEIMRHLGLIPHGPSQ